MDILIKTAKNYESKITKFKTVTFWVYLSQFNVDVRYMEFIQE